MRFCSRCGFPLAVVAELVRTGGALAESGEKAKGELSPRQRGIRWGVILMMISVLLVPVAGMMMNVDEDFAVLFIPTFLIFVIGVVRLLHAFLLASKTPTEKASQATAKANSLPGGYQPPLPAGQSIPVTNWRQPVNTAEMAPRPSVTDHTTKLLSDETDGR